MQQQVFPQDESLALLCEQFLCVPGGDDSFLNQTISNAFGILGLIRRDLGIGVADMVSTSTSCRMAWTRTIFIPWRNQSETPAR